MIAPKMFRLACPLSNEPDAWIAALNVHLPHYGIDTLKRQAMFLSQTGHESADYNRVHENLNYSASALRRVFPKYYPNDAKANAHARKPELICNTIYFGRMGNIHAGDPWRFKGIGIIQLTGRDNHTAFGKSIGMTAEEARAYIESSKSAMIHAACWFWSANRLNAYADVMDVTGCSKRINGGFNGLEDRRKRYNRIMTTLS